MNQGYRQEVFNVLLAQLLQERGVVSAPEEVLVTKPGGSRKMPDVLVDFSGLRTAIEGEVSDQPHAENKALASARKRVEDGIAHIGVAMIYPAMLRHVQFTELRGQLSACALRIAVVTEGGETGFAEGSVDDLADILRHTFDQLVQEDVVTRAVAVMESGIETFAGVVSSSSATVLRLADALGIRELPAKEKMPDEE